MTNNQNSRLAGLPGRVNGNADRFPVHAQGGCPSASGPAPASAERDGPPVQLAHAASDDAGGATVASAALAAVAGADRQAYAAAAPSPPNGASSRARSNAKNKRNGSAAPGDDQPNQTSNEKMELPRGRSPLPTDPTEFVQEIHRKIDLMEVWHSLLRSEDQKVQQRAAERLTDMFYKGAATSGEESQQIVVDIESSAVSSATEGAKK